jgi:hypothetical protein
MMWAQGVFCWRRRDGFLLGHVQMADASKQVVERDLMRADHPINFQFLSALKLHLLAMAPKTGAKRSAPPTLVSYFDFSPVSLTPSRPRRNDAN